MQDNVNTTYVAPKCKFWDYNINKTTTTFGSFQKNEIEKSILLCFYVLSLEIGSPYLLHQYSDATHNCLQIWDATIHERVFSASPSFPKRRNEHGLKIYSTQS